MAFESARTTAIAGLMLLGFLGFGCNGAEEGQEGDVSEELAQETLDTSLSDSAGDGAADQYADQSADRVIAESRRRVEEQMARVRERSPARYDCSADQRLDSAPPIPVADTASLGSSIAEHFPGYRLSTEREIGCRFPLIDGSGPEDYRGERWGSGEAWWVWRGDFDGDGRSDRLVLLTREDDPSRDLLGVLFASGGAAEVGSSGGWGVNTVPAGRSISPVAGGEPFRLETDAIEIIAWGKAAELLLWRDGEFWRVTTAD